MELIVDFGGVGGRELFEIFYGHKKCSYVLRKCMERFKIVI